MWGVIPIEKVFPSAMTHTVYIYMICSTSTLRIITLSKYNIATLVSRV